MLEPEERFPSSKDSLVMLSTRHFSSEDKVLVDIVEQHDRNQKTDEDEHKDERSG